MRIMVTGAYGYSGKYIAARLLDLGHDVVTLTNHPGREDPFDGSVQSFPFHFDDPRRLTEHLRGSDVLVNTYWVRFNHRDFSFREAIANSKTLFAAARDAGVRRIVHVSITNPDIHSKLPYFSGKAEVEESLKATGVSHAILRPAVLFGKEDILINNIAWTLRHLPVFGVFGNGAYRLQPIYVDDLAAAIVEQALGSASVTIDAIGPETFTFRNLVRTIRGALGARRLILPVPPALAYAFGRAMGLLVNDVIITRDEITGLMEERLYVASPPLGTTRLSDWIANSKHTLGFEYHSELAPRSRSSR